METAAIGESQMLCTSWRADDLGRLLEIDADFLEFLGLEEGKALDSGWLSRAPEGERDRVFQTWNSGFKGSLPWSLRYHLHTRCGLREFITQAAPEGGGWRGLNIELAPLTDVVQPAVSVLENMSEAFMAVDRDWRFTYLNPQTRPLIGKPREELLGKVIWEVIPEIVGSPFEEACRQAVQNRTTGRIEEYFKELKKSFLVNICPGPDGLTIFFQDISGQRQAEEGLLLSEQRLQFAVESAQLGVWHWDIESDLLLWSPTVRSHFWLPNDAEVSYQVFLDRLHPDDRKAVDAAVRTAIDNGTDFDVEYRTISSAGEERWIAAKGKGYFSADGKCKNFIGITMDVSARKKAEEYIYRLNQVLERRVEERTAELVAANRELEGFTYSVSHDLRSPLRAIMTSSMILLEDYADKLDREAREQLVRQAAAAKKLNKLIDDILHLSRLGRSELAKADIDLSDLAQEVAGEVTQRRQDQSPIFDIETGVRANADPKMIRFVLENLFDNGCKFQPPGQQPAVSFGAGLFDGHYAYFVRDNGIGFDEAYSDRIFLPFERLNKDTDFPGTGIGLANVKRIIDRHGGRIWVQSAPGHGSTFFFSLPEHLEVA